jgi:TfoX/Sxy family transcriptional regulator of competence genes
MAYDEDLANRLRVLLGPTGTVEEKRMFGGLAFMVDGHLAVGAMSRGTMLARVGKAAAPTYTGSHAREMDMKGKPMPGWLVVDAEAVASDDDLRMWVDRCVGFIRSGELPRRI